MFKIVESFHWNREPVPDSILAASSAPHPSQSFKKPPSSALRVTFPASGMSVYLRSHCAQVIDGFGSWTKAKFVEVVSLVQNWHRAKYLPLSDLKAYLPFDWS